MFSDFRGSVDCIVLAGGKSRRMGTCKALARFNGEPMVAAVFNNAKPLFRRVIVVVKNSSQRHAIERVLHRSVATDGSRSFSPAVGMKAGAARSDADAFFVIACDLPYVRRGTISRLLKHAGRDCVAYAHDGHYEPLCALYSRRFIEALQPSESIQEAIRAERNKKTIRTRNARQFANVNSKEGLEY
jgi:molybdopterin-guanine dinucleotide biosynthesis protein A